MAIAVHSAETWNSGGAYEAYGGRWSRRVAVEFVDWLDMRRDRRWIDIGCGTGGLTETIFARCAPAAVAGIDPSAGYIAHAREHVEDPRATFEVGNAEALPFPDGTFDVAVCGLVLNFVRDQERCIAEMKRVLQAGGTAALYVWDYAGEMQLMRYFWNAAVDLDPEAAALDQGQRFSVCKPEPLLAIFNEAGFVRVECTRFDIATVFKDFDDYWQPFLGGQGSAPTYCAALSNEQRSRLRDRLCATLPTGLGGTIRLSARAWAVRGLRPSEME
jgi:SAM-dependent methyltransferase